MSVSAGLPDVSASLARQSRERPDQAAVIHKGETLSFAALEAEVEALSRGLRALGLSPGARAALLVPPGPQFAALSFALFRSGLVPVLIDPGIGAASLGRCLDEAAPEVFIGSPKALAARAALGWGRASIKTLVRASGLWPGALSLAKLKSIGKGAVALGGKAVPDAAQDGSLPLAAQDGSLPLAAQDGSLPLAAAILFTSGSTGAPKGAVYTRGMFSAQLGLLRELFSIEPGQVSVPTFPLFGLFDLALGQTIVVPDMDATRPADVDPREIIACVERHGACQLFGSPALLDAVGRYGERTGARLPSLKRVLSAGAPVSWRILKRFKKLLEPGCPIYTPYGATEALPVALISSDEVLNDAAGGSARGKGTCVGRPVPGAEVRVIKVTDEPIERWSDSWLAAEGEVGELVVSGPMVSAAYWSRAGDTARAKIVEGDRIWHRMGDTGYFDRLRRVWFTGRKSQRVDLGTRTLFTVACEGVFNAHPKVKRSALVGVKALGRTLPVLCVELEASARGEEERVRGELLALAGQNELTQPIETVLFHPKFPVDIRHNAKIFREKLAAWAQRRLQR